MTYVGARGCITHAQLDKLGSQWVVQPKMDGVYARVSTDASGSISGVMSRASKPLSHSIKLHGIRDAVLCGELEAYTERSQDAVKRNGYQRLWLFDCLKIDGRDLSGETYQTRRDALQRAIANAEASLQRDRAGRVHDAAGRFGPKLWRQVRVVPQLRAKGWTQMWGSHVEAEHGEGLVAVNTRSRAGTRGSKRKCKPVDHVTMTVLRVDDKCVELNYWGQRRGIIVSKGKHNPVPGDGVDVAVEGFYRSGLPRFARIVRVRRDI